jgi:hypothetical protein
MSLLSRPGRCQKLKGHARSKRTVSEELESVAAGSEELESVAVGSEEDPVAVGSRDDAASERRTGCVEGQHLRVEESIITHGGSINFAFL